MGYRLRLLDGTVGTPAVKWENDPDTGFYRIGANNLGLALGGVKQIDYATTGISYTPPIIAPAATTSIPSLRVPHGTAPSAPTNGDWWSTTSGFAGRVNGVTHNFRDGVLVAALYTSNAGQTISSGAAPTIVNFEDQEADTDSAVTIGASWKFTCPTGKGGLYFIAALITYDTSTGWVDPEPATLLLYKNGSLYAQLDRQDYGLGGANGYKVVRGSRLVSLVPTDYIDIRTEQSSGGSLSLLNATAYNYVSIARMGVTS